MKMGFLLSLLLPVISFANSGAHGGHEVHFDAHAQKIVISQTINFIILVSLLTFLMKAKIKSFFADKKEAYVKAAEKSKAAQVSAESSFNELRVRLDKLQSTADESVSRARAEAADLKKQIIDEANALSAQIKRETETFAALEVEKGKRQIKSLLVSESIQLARAQLGTKISSEDHQRLQGDFIQNIQGVQP